MGVGHALRMLGDDLGQLLRSFEFRVDSTSVSRAPVTQGELRIRAQPDMADLPNFLQGQYLLLPVFPAK